MQDPLIEQLRDIKQMISRVDAEDLNITKIASITDNIVKDKPNRYKIKYKKLKK